MASTCICCLVCLPDDDEKQPRNCVSDDTIHCLLAGAAKAQLSLVRGPEICASPRGGQQCPAVPERSDSVRAGLTPSHARNNHHLFQCLLCGRLGAARTWLSWRPWPVSGESLRHRPAGSKSRSRQPRCEFPGRGSGGGAG